MPTKKVEEVKEEPKKDLVACEILRAIGIDATPDVIEAARHRSELRGMRFSSAGLTTMIHPAKGDEDPVIMDLERGLAKKLQANGAVRVVI